MNEDGATDGGPDQLAGGLVKGLTRIWRGRPGVCAAPGRGLVDRVLAARGLGDPHAAAAFLHPSLRQLHDPSLMPDMDRAAERLLGAARAGQRIVIYGDYDVDGVSATAILWHTIRVLFPGADVSWYVPHRIDEGYGLNSDALREIAGAGASVVVSVDCGVTAVEPARTARDLGIDLIITDHHTPPADAHALPPAFAVVHPRRAGSAYPFGDLCGAGVAFKLAWRMATMHAGSQRVPEPVRAHLIEMLALASLGVVADVVPLVGENRVIAAFGLSRVRTSAIEGLRALVHAAGLEGENVQSHDVGFRLGPRLNACGRLGHARDAVELLTTATGERARDIAAALTKLNDDRRAVELRIFREASERAVAAGMTRDDRRAIVLTDPQWHAGVVGIVCSRLVERFHRPAILLGERDGVCHGSGRSVEGFDLAGALSLCSGRLLSHGGHDMAAGLKVRRELLDGFIEDFTTHANQAIRPEHLAGRAAYDCDASIAELDLSAVRSLDALAPFGRENPAVTLRVRRGRIAAAQSLGKEGRHLSMFLKDAGRALRVVGWGWGDRLAACPDGAAVEALIHPTVSTFGGGARVEAELIDLRVLAG